MLDQIVCNDPQHKTLAQQIYKRGLELLEEKKHSENLLYNISEAVISVDHGYQIKIINKAAEELVGLSTEQVEGKNLKDILILQTEKEQKILPQDYCFKSSDVLMQNLVHELNGNRKYLKLQSTTIKNSAGEEESIITLTDVTREKVLEKSKDEFISIASHELRTPMTIIKSYLWMLEKGKGGELNAKQKDYLGKATGGVERMLSMINDTLNASKIDQGKVQIKIEEINVKNFLDEVIPDFKIKAGEKNLELKVESCNDCPVVYSDKGKLREIVTNLLGNSIKFTSVGWVSLNVTKEDGAFVKFEVTDTGKGIGPEDIKRLFQKFGRIDNSYQTVAEAGGTGLGLYIVKNMVESMGGTVGVHSDGIGKGATFWFTLPSIYNNIPKSLMESSVVSLAPTLETHITSLCLV